MSGKSIRIKRSWSNEELTIARAFERELTSYDGGVAESAEATARSAASKLGDLIEKLHEIGVLSSEQVLDLLPGSWDAIES